MNEREQMIGYFKQVLRDHDNGDLTPVVVSWAELEWFVEQVEQSAEAVEVAEARLAVDEAWNDPTFGDKVIAYENAVEAYRAAKALKAYRAAKGNT